MAGATRAQTSEMGPPTSSTLPGINTIDEAAQIPSIQAFGNAFPGSGCPSEAKGPCPLAEKVYMALEERGLPYVATYMEESADKPDWFLVKNPSGLLPVLRDGETWVQGSEAILDYLCRKYPSESQPFQAPDDIENKVNNMIQKQFCSLNDWLQTKNKDDNLGHGYMEALKEVNDHLKQNGPYLAGDKPTDLDFDFAPKLHHARTLLLHFMDFEIPSELSNVMEYIKLMESRPSFKRINSPDSDIIFSWQKKLSLPEKVPLTQSS